MRMCEYANNLLDMSLLSYIIKKDGRIIYDSRPSYGSLLVILGTFSSPFDMLFPRMNGDIDYITLFDCDYGICFENIIEIEYKIDILYVRIKSK